MHAESSACLQGAYSDHCISDPTLLWNIDKDVCCRYYHTIPLLLWCTRLPTTVRLSLWLCIEVIFNIFPSTPETSLALLGCHLLILLALAFAPAERGSDRTH